MPEHEGHYTMDHSSFVYLQAPDGRLLDFYGTDDSAAIIAESVRTRLGQG